MELLTIIERLGVYGVVTIGAAWLLRQLATLFFSQELETFKIRVQSEHDRSLEEFKAALRRDAHERGVRRTRFLERRIDVLDGIYQGLVATQRLLEEAISPLSIKGQRPKEPVFKEAVKQGNEHLLFCEQNRPWVDDTELLALIDQYNDAIVSAANAFQFKDLRASDDLAGWRRALKKQDEAKEIRGRIEVAIREILQADDP